jgi:hypothetical protein
MNNVNRELNIDELDAVSGGSFFGVVFTLMGNPTAGHVVDQAVDALPKAHTPV